MSHRDRRAACPSANAQARVIDRSAGVPHTLTPQAAVASTGRGGRARVVGDHSIRWQRRGAGGEALCSWRFCSARSLSCRLPWGSILVCDRRPAQPAGVREPIRSATPRPLCVRSVARRAFASRTRAIRGGHSCVALRISPAQRVLPRQTLLAGEHRSRVLLGVTVNRSVTLRLLEVVANRIVWGNPRVSHVDAHLYFPVPVIAKSWAAFAPELGGRHSHMMTVNVTFTFNCALANTITGDVCVNSVVSSVRRVLRGYVVVDAPDEVARSHRCGTARSRWGSICRARGRIGSSPPALVVEHRSHLAVLFARFGSDNCRPTYTVLSPSLFVSGAVRPPVKPCLTPPEVGGSK